MKAFKSWRKSRLLGYTRPGPEDPPDAEVEAYALSFRVTGLSPFGGRLPLPWEYRGWRWALRAARAWDEA